MNTVNLAIFTYCIVEGRAVASGVKGGDNSRGPHKIQELYYIGPCSVNNSNILLVI